MDTGATCGETRSSLQADFSYRAPQSCAAVPQDQRRCGVRIKNVPALEREELAASGFAPHKSFSTWEADSRGCSNCVYRLGCGGRSAGRFGYAAALSSLFR
jgi:hypothetical protein